MLLTATLAVALAVPNPAAADACTAPGEKGAKVAQPTAIPATTATKAAKGDPKARDAAQRGLDWLGQAARTWQDGHKCYGCHVQAVTMEAMTVGLSHQYTVKPA